MGTELKDSKGQKQSKGSNKNGKPLKQKENQKGTLPIKGFRLWLFRATAVIVIPALFLVLLEITLRLISYGYNPSAIVKCWLNDQPAYCDNLKFSTCR